MELIGIFINGFAQTQFDIQSKLNSQWPIENHSSKSIVNRANIHVAAL